LKNVQRSSSSEADAEIEEFLKDASLVMKNEKPDYITTRTEYQRLSSYNRLFCGSAAIGNGTADHNEILTCIREQNMDNTMPME